MKLYQSGLSPNSKRVRICANEIGIPLQLVNLDFAKGENRAPEYLAKNPMGKVPTLEDDDGFLLWESVAILYYLAEKHPQAKLVPAGARGLADALRWTHWNSAHLEPPFVTLVVERFFRKMRGESEDEGKTAAAEEEIARYAKVLDRHLEGKTWVLGDAYSVADIAIGTNVELGGMLAVDWAPYPNVQAWFARVSSRDAWKKALRRFRTSRGSARRGNRETRNHFSFSSPCLRPSLCSAAGEASA